VGLNDRCGLLVNSSRDIIFADSTLNYAEAAATRAMEVQQEMAGLLVEKGLIGG
jgi:orotidine-5'-phosphate decarboxylase